MVRIQQPEEPVDLSALFGQIGQTEQQPEEPFGDFLEQFGYNKKFNGK